MSLRDDVDRLLPGWESWYPSLFHAAEDLGLIRARVCSPGSLMISQRHAKIYSEAVHAFRVQWSVEDSEGESQILPFKGKSNGGRVESANRKSQPLRVEQDPMEEFLSNGEDALDHLRTSERKNADPQALDDDPDAGDTADDNSDSVSSDE